MANFTDQQPRTATEKDCAGQWAGAKKGEGFRCTMCGHRFKVGDQWRWVYGQGKAVNFLVCSSCDGPDVLERWIAHIAEWKRLSQGPFWYFDRKGD